VGIITDLSQDIEMKLELQRCESVQTGNGEFIKTEGLTVNDEQVADDLVDGHVNIYVSLNYPVKRD